MKYLFILLLLICNKVFSQLENDFNNVQSYYQKLVAELEQKRDNEVKNLPPKNYSINKEKILVKYNTIILQTIREGKEKLNKIKKEIDNIQLQEEARNLELLKYSETDKFKLELYILYQFSLWAKKGEFEKKSEWDSRIKDSSSIKIDKIATNEIFKIFKERQEIYSFSEGVYDNEKRVIYDPENEILKLIIRTTFRDNDTFELKLNKKIAEKIKEKSHNISFVKFYPKQIHLFNNNWVFTEGVFLFNFDNIDFCENDFNKCSEKIQEKDDIVLYHKTLMKESNELGGNYNKAVKDSFIFKNILSEQNDLDKGLYFYLYTDKNINLNELENVKINFEKLKIEDLEFLHKKTNSSNM